MADEAGTTKATGGALAGKGPEAGAEGGHRTGSRHRSPRSSWHWRHSRSESVDSRRRRHRLVRQLLMVAVGLLALVSAALGVLWWHDHAVLRDDREAERARTAKAEQLYKAREEEIASLRAQLADLTEGRLPKPLLPLEVDTFIDLGEVKSPASASLRSILFTRVGTKDNLGYEYRLTCHNGLAESIQPGYLVLVFNGVGIQIGSADVERSLDWTRLGATGLAPGESCSFSGRIDLQFQDAPAYFLVLDVAHGDKLPRLMP